MRPLSPLAATLALGCVAAPIAENQAEVDQVEENNYALSVTKDLWTDHLVAPDVDAIVRAEWAPDDEGPGCAVGVVQGDETIYLKGYGMASATEPWSVATVAPVGSIDDGVRPLRRRARRRHAVRRPRPAGARRPARRGLDGDLRGPRGGGPGPAVRGRGRGVPRRDRGLAPRRGPVSAPRG